MKIKLFTFIICILFFQQGKANLEYNDKAQNIYNLIFSLKIDKAKIQLESFKNDYPQNGIYIHLENYIDVITIFLSEEKSLYKKLKNNKSKRLQDLKSFEKQSPYYKYIQADIELQWALINLKFSEYLTAFLSVKRAYNLLNKNEEDFPDFLPNKKSLGVLHAIVGAIPKKYKWGVKLLSGMDGTIEQGQSELLDIIKKAKHEDFPFIKETYALYSFISLHLKNNSEVAWQTITEANLSPSTSRMDCFVIANLAMRTGRFKKAKSVLQNKPQGLEYYAFPYLDYLEGLVALYQLDEDADIYFIYYLENFNGINYIKESYQKLAWHSLIKGDNDGYFEYMEYCKNEGSTKMGGDKNALKEALKNTLPQVDLLKGRILFDGANYTLAKEVLEKCNQSKFTENQKLEYVYRLARIEHKLNNLDQALNLYRTTIKNGYDSPDYFACNASLKMGEIYESQNNCKKAKDAYNKCLDIDPYDYAHSLHALAKAGLNRMSDCF